MKPGYGDLKELINCSLYHSRSILKISSKSYWTCFSNIVRNTYPPSPNATLIKEPWSRWRSGTSHFLKIAYYMFADPPWIFDQQPIICFDNIVNRQTPMKTLPLQVAKVIISNGRQIVVFVGGNKIKYTNNLFLAQFLWTQICESPNKPTCFVIYHFDIIWCSTFLDKYGPSTNAQ